MVQRKPLCFYCSTWHPWSKWSIIDIYTPTVLIRISWYRGIFGNTAILELQSTDNIWQYTWRAPVLSQNVGSCNPFKQHSKAYKALTFVYKDHTLHNSGNVFSWRPRIMQPWPPCELSYKKEHSVSVISKSFCYSRITGETLIQSWRISSGFFSTLPL